MYQAMSDVWQHRFEKRQTALANIQQTDDFKASEDLLEIPDPKDKCSKRTWEYMVKELRARIRSLKPADNTES